MKRFDFDVPAIRKGKLKMIVFEALTTLILGAFYWTMPSFKWFFLMLSGLVFLSFAWDLIDLPSRLRKLSDDAVYIGNGFFCISSASANKLPLASLELQKIKKNRDGNVKSITLRETEFNHKIKIDNLIDMNSVHECLKTELKPNQR